MKKVLTADDPQTIGITLCEVNFERSHAQYNTLSDLSVPLEPFLFVGIKLRVKNLKSYWFCIILIQKTRKIFSLADSSGVIL